MTIPRALSAILLASVVVLMTAPVGVAVATEASSAPAATTDDGTAETPVRSRPIVATKRIVVAKRKDGLRITTRLEGPLVAGQPTRARTTVRNMGGRPISWDLGINGVALAAWMTDASWRIGEPIVELPEFGSPGFFAARNHLKVDLAGEMSPLATRIWLPFELRKVDGVPVESEDFRVPLRIRPGERIDFVHEWGGYTGLSGGLAGSGGLPPSGRARVVISVNFDSEGPGRHVDRMSADTTVVGGWDEERLHPLEVVDAALADPAFAQLMDEADFLRYDTGYRTYVPEADRWYVGSCGRPEGAEIQYWRLGAVDPVSGEVIELLEGFGNETCEPGTWPLATGPMASPSESPFEAAPLTSAATGDGDS